MLAPRDGSGGRGKQRDAEVSRARVMAAAAVEFAARGFDGAKVDAIAARAGVNKAMLYYHFTGKAALYRGVIGEMFGAIATALRAVRQAGGTPESQLQAFIATMAREGQARPHFPAIWLRELADGGRHLGERNFNDMVAIIGTLASILREGEAAGRFAVVPPFLAQIGIVAPLLMFMATAPLRARLRRRLPAVPAEIPPGAFIDYVQSMTLGALSAPRPSRPAGTR